MCIHSLEGCAESGIGKGEGKLSEARVIGVFVCVGVVVVVVVVVVKVPGAGPAQGAAGPVLAGPRPEGAGRRRGRGLFWPSFG